MSVEAQTAWQSGLVQSLTCAKVLVTALATMQCFASSIIAQVHVISYVAIRVMFKQFHHLQEGLLLQLICPLLSGGYCIEGFCHT